MELKYQGNTLRGCSWLLSRKRGEPLFSLGANTADFFFYPAFYLFCFLQPLYQLVLPIMKPPASFLNEGFVIKAYFTASSWMCLVLVYLDVESSHCSPLVILEITVSQCTEIFCNYEGTTSVGKRWFGIIRKKTVEDSRTKYSDREKKKRAAKMWSPHGKKILKWKLLS